MELLVERNANSNGMNASVGFLVALLGCFKQLMKNGKVQWGKKI